MRSIAAVALLLLAALFASASCENSSTPGSGSTSAGGGSCSAETECGSAQLGCIACAEAGPCIEELNRCHMSDECLSYARCLQGCVQGDDECAIACANEAPEGESAYSRLLQCAICEQCFVVCDGPGNGCPQ